MKKKLVLVFSFVVVLCVGVAIGKFNNTNNVYEEKSEQKQKKNTNMLSMMLETEAESGNYEMTTRDSWPTSGYKFNSTLSKCENGGELSWDDVNKRVLMSGNTSDKCYVYFDIAVLNLSLDNYTFNWDSVDGASSYQIYSNDELLTSTSDTSAEIYGYYNEPGTYNVNVKAVDDSNTVLLESNSVSYSLEKLDLDLSGTYTSSVSGRIGMCAPDNSICYYTYAGSGDIGNCIYNTDFTVLSVNNEDIVVNIIDYSKYDKVFIGDAGDYNKSFSNVNLFKNNYCLTKDSYCLSYRISNFSNTNNTNKYKFYYDNSAKSLKYFTSTNGNRFFVIQFVVPGKIGSDWYNAFFSCLCLSSNTDVYVYDKKKKKFKKKKISEVDYDDEILCWDFDNGEFAIAKPIWIKKCEQTNKYNLLKFSDGSTLETINQHRIFNVEKGMFTYPMSDDTPIGTTTFNSKGEYVKLISKEVIEKPIDYYNVMTEYLINLFANDILTSCRLSNMYKVKDMKYVCNKKRNNGYDLSKYDEKLVNGLRLKEQDIEETKLKTYVDNMLRLMK